MNKIDRKISKVDCIKAICNTTDECIFVEQLFGSVDLEKRQEYLNCLADDWGEKAADNDLTLIILSEPIIGQGEGYCDLLVEEE